MANGRWPEAVGEGLWLQGLAHSNLLAISSLRTVVQLPRTREARATPVNVGTEQA
jgi:hypothetical protein